MQPMTSQTRRLPLRCQPYLVPTRHRGGDASITPGLSHLTGHIPQESSTYVTSDGEFVAWGWLSGEEIDAGLQALNLASKVTLQQSTGPFCELPHVPEGQSVIFLTLGHYVSVSNVKRKLVFFDPLGKPPQTYFGFAVKQLCPVGLQVQHHTSALCGNFCLFFLHMLYRCCNIHGHTKDTVIQPIRATLQRFLYVIPQDLKFNSLLMEYFTADHRIGEEWGHTKGKYKRMRMYDSCLSSRALLC
uniref:LO8 protein n=1 Tax=Retropinna adomavirus 3 TaxID=3064108 RepID=A0AA49X6D8_9VIRU|nr:MAG: LO8 protein [Retropinna adomavirus 3]